MSQEASRPAFGPEVFLQRKAAKAQRQMEATEAFEHRLARNVTRVALRRDVPLDDVPLPEEGALMRLHDVEHLFYRHVTLMPCRRSGANVSMLAVLRRLPKLPLWESLQDARDAAGGGASGGFGVVFRMRSPEGTQDFVIHSLASETDLRHEAKADWRVMLAVEGLDCELTLQSWDAFLYHYIRRV